MITGFGSSNGIILDFDIPQTPLYAQVSKKEMRRLVSNLFQMQYTIS